MRSIQVTVLDERFCGWGSILGRLSGVRVQIESVGKGDPTAVVPRVDGHDVTTLPALDMIVVTQGDYRRICMDAKPRLEGDCSEKRLGDRSEGLWPPAPPLFSPLGLRGGGLALGNLIESKKRGADVMWTQLLRPSGIARRTSMVVLSMSAP